VCETVSLPTHSRLYFHSLLYITIVEEHTLFSRAAVQFDRLQSRVWIECDGLFSVSYVLILWCRVPLFSGTQRDVQNARFGLFLTADCALCQAFLVEFLVFCVFHWAFNSGTKGLNV